MMLRWNKLWPEQPSGPRIMPVWRVRLTAKSRFEAVDLSLVAERAGPSDWV